MDWYQFFEFTYLKSYTYLQELKENSLKVWTQLDIGKWNDTKEWELVVPATYIIGKDGKVVKSFVDPDFKKRMDTDDILNTLKSI